MNHLENRVNHYREETLPAADKTTSKVRLENNQIALMRLEADVRLREAELKLREKELAAKIEADKTQRETLSLREKEIGAKIKSDTMQHRANLTNFCVVVVAALMGVTGTVFSVNKQAQSALELSQQQQKSSLLLEQKQAESQLVLRVIQTDDLKQSRKNLLFLIKAGFVEDPSGKILLLAHDPATSPMLPAVTDSSEKRVKLEPDTELHDVIADNEPSR